MPKERFILYPNAGRETDPTLLLGWAGWDHAQQSLALATIITERQAEGWVADRLVPLVAGLEELQPWVEQWHGEVDPAYGVSMATFCREQLTNGAAQVGKTLAEAPPMATRSQKGPVDRPANLRIFIKCTQMGQNTRDQEFLADPNLAWRRGFSAAGMGCGRLRGAGITDVLRRRRGARGRGEVPGP